MFHQVKKLFVRMVPKKLLWRFAAQNIEYNFHEKMNEWRQSPEFMKQTRELFMKWDINEDDFANEYVLDLGCGPRLRSKYFRQAKLIAVDPLADKYLQGLEWSDLRDAEKVYSIPAEQAIPELKGQISMIMCINVLDHVFDYVAVLQNAYNLLKDGGLFLLSVDLHEDPSLTHPIPLIYDTLKSELLRIGFSSEKEWDDAVYGEGEAYTFKLVK